MLRQSAKHGHRRIDSSEISLAKLAEYAISEVALGKKSMDAKPDTMAIDRLFEAAIGPDPLLCRDVAAGLVADGVSVDEICDIYVPAVARRMGDDWCTDHLSFAAVTIGSARLQYLLREMGPGHADDLRREGRALESPIVLLVSAEASHTLGVMVLARQLRCRGYSVKLALAASTEELVGLIRSTNFNAIFISASIEESVEALRDMVAALRTSVAALPPILMGGAILALKSDVQAITGVDSVSTNVDEALELCGLKRHDKI